MVEQRIVRVLILALLALLVEKNASTDSPRRSFWNGWTCDELTPNLCKLERKSGFIPVRDGWKVRYWRYYGRRQMNNNDVPDGVEMLPIVVLHGGPGFPHPYLLPLRQQACRGRDVIFYDQAGCGESAWSFQPETGHGVVNSLQPLEDNLTSSFPWLLDPSYYAMEELPAVLSYLRLERYHLFGHSWGTMLAQLFALDTNASGLVSMVLSGPLSDSDLWEKALWDNETGVLGTLPPFVQNRIHTLEAGGQFNSPEYAAIDSALTGLSTCRTAPAPDCYARSVEGICKDIYVEMQGPSEFSNGGVLATFNTTDRLSELDRFPVLLTSGAYDTIRPSVVSVIHQELPLSEWVIYPYSGHVSAIDEPERMNDDVFDFFDRVEEALRTDQPFKPKSQRREGAIDSTTRTRIRALASAIAMATFFLGAILCAVIISYRNRDQGYQRL